LPGPNVRKSLLFAAAVAALLAPGCGTGNSVDRDKAQTRLDLCAEFLLKGAYESAETECHKALGYNPGEHRAYNMLGLVDLRRASDMHSILEIQECLTGVDAEGLSAQKDKYLAQARADFVHAAKLRTEYGEAYQNQATVDLLLQDYERAADGYKRALEYANQLDSTSLARANLAWAYFNLDRLPEAAAELRQALKFEPQMCLAHYRLGRVYFTRKEWDKALSEFEKVVAQPKACPIQEAHLFLMKTYVQKGLGANLPKLLAGCLSLGEQSCIAAQCRALVPQSSMTVTSP
jgi:tetratricopeptide (TPR) repeat protein